MCCGQRKRPLDRTARGSPPNAAVEPRGHVQIAAARTTDLPQPQPQLQPQPQPQPYSQYHFQPQPHSQYPYQPARFGSSSIAAPALFPQAPSFHLMAHAALGNAATPAASADGTVAAADGTVAAATAAANANANANATATAAKPAAQGRPAPLSRQSLTDFMVSRPWPVR